MMTILHNHDCESEYHAHCWQLCTVYLDCFSLQASRSTLCHQEGRQNTNEGVTAELSQSSWLLSQPSESIWKRLTPQKLLGVFLEQRLVGGSLDLEPLQRSCHIITLWCHIVAPEEDKVARAPKRLKVKAPPPTFAPRIACRIFGLPPVPGWQVRMTADLTGQAVLDRVRHSVIVRMQMQVERAVAVMAALHIYVFVGQAASQHLERCLAHSLSWQTCSRDGKLCMIVPGQCLQWHSCRLACIKGPEDKRGCKASRYTCINTRAGSLHSRRH